MESTIKGEYMGHGRERVLTAVSKDVRGQQQGGAGADSSKQRRPWGSNTGERVLTAVSKDVRGAATRGQDTPGIPEGARRGCTECKQPQALWYQTEACQGCMCGL